MIKKIRNNPILDKNNTKNSIAVKYIPTWNLENGVLTTIIFVHVPGVTRDLKTDTSNRRQATVYITFSGLIT